MLLRYAVDTNILLRLSSRAHPQHALISRALHRLVEQGVELCFTPQNAGEFWNVCTRPVERNGLGLSVEETNGQLLAVEEMMTLLPEHAGVYRLWRHLLLLNEVRGVQVHDAHLAAVLEANRVRHLLTFNTSDFKRFTSLIAVHPDAVR